MNGNAGRNSSKVRHASADWAQPRKKPTRPPSLPQGRWLGDFEPLSPAERALVDCCARGEAWEPEGWDGKRPETASAANSIRAGLIRFFVLGGDVEHPVHEHGVQARGAWFEDALDLDQVGSVFRLAMFDCHFVRPITMRDARLVRLTLHGSRFTGLDAERSIISGSMFLDKATCDGKVSLSGASIGGQLACEGATFRHCDSNGNPSGTAFNAQRASVTGGVFLRGATFDGAVSLSGAIIGGQLACESATLRHCISDGGANGKALDAQGASLDGGVFLLDAICNGTVSFAGANIGGQLACNGATFRHCDQDGSASGTALDAQRATR